MNKEVEIIELSEQKEAKVQGILEDISKAIIKHSVTPGDFDYLQQRYLKVIEEDHKWHKEFYKV